MSLVKVSDAGGDPITLLEVDGVYYPKSKVDIVKGIPDVKIRDDDIFICAYPKCGTHWVWEMTRLILAGTTDVAVTEKDELQLEFTSDEELNTFPSPRILNTHVLFKDMPRAMLEKKTKIIYVLRNPKDMAVSFYHHHKKLTKYYEYYGSWKNYLPLIMDGKVDSGSWFEYILEWESAKKQHPEMPILTLVYEDLKENSVPGVREIAKFLGREGTEEFYKEVADKCSFKKMQEMKGHLIKADNGAPVMYRKGEVGDWKNWFTVAQNEMFDNVLKKKMAGCDVSFRYTL